MSLQDVLSRMDLAVYPQVALLLFLGVFLAVAVRTARRPSQHMEQAAGMPLEEAALASLKREEESDERRG